MRCDRYAECSATTGELVKEVFEDIAQMATAISSVKNAQTTTTPITAGRMMKTMGGKEEGYDKNEEEGGCLVM